MGPEVGVEVRGFVKASATHLTAQIPVSIFGRSLRGDGRRAGQRAVRAGGAAFRVALGFPHAMGNEAVPGEGASGGEADAALQALE